MAVPSSVGRFFQPLATIGPAVYIALTFGIRSLASFVPRFGRGAAEVAAEGVARRDAETAIGLLDLEMVMQSLDARLTIDQSRERLGPHERDLYLQVTRLIAAGIVHSYREAKDVPPEPVARRSQHAKHHGCVRARFIVDEQLSPDVAVGVFRRGARYDAILRFSNAHGSPRADRKGDGRGLAIKLKSEDGRGEQDFVLVNHPVFFVDDVAEYARFMEIIHSRGNPLMTIMRFVAFFVPWRLRKGFIFLRIKFTRIEDPFTASYHSMSPFALGDQVVRYAVTPAEPAAGEPGGGVEAERSLDFLRTRMAERLAADVAFDFSVQIRDQPTLADVEHASRAWRRPADRTVRLARIEVSRQTFATTDQLCYCENLRFNPWNAGPDHRPLGGINRIRLLAYLTSARVRRQLNMVDTK